MTADDVTTLTKLLQGLAEVFGEQFSDVKAELYIAALADLEIGEIQTACNTLLREAKFFPKPAEIRETLKGSLDERAAQAWAQVKDGANSLGAFTSVWFEDVATAIALSQTFGDWPYFCAVELEPPMWASKRKEFLTLYRNAQRRDLRQERDSAYLVGYHEQQNAMSAGMWTRGPQTPTYAQDVGLIPRIGAPRTVRGQFSTKTGRLCGDVAARLLLSASVDEAVAAITEGSRAALELATSRVDEQKALPEAREVSAGDAIARIRDEVERRSALVKS